MLSALEGLRFGEQLQEHVLGRVLGICRATQIGAANAIDGADMLLIKSNKARFFLLVQCDKTTLLNNTIGGVPVSDTFLGRSSLNGAV